MDETAVAFRAEVAFRVLLFPEALFGGLDRAENRRRAVIRPIDADAEVDLVLPLVGGELGDQREQRIGRSVLQAVEHARPMLSHGRESNR